MNMKKTIAALAAGAVAVSAMATSVSALQDQTLTYNLVASNPTVTNGKVTFQVTVQHVSSKLDGLKFYGINGNFDLKDVTIRVIDDLQAEQNRTYNYATGGTNYNKNLTADGFVFNNELNFLDSYSGSGTLILTMNCEFSKRFTQDDINAAVNNTIRILPAMLLRGDGNDWNVYTSSSPNARGRISKDGKSPASWAATNGTPANLFVPSEGLDASGDPYVGWNFADGTDYYTADGVTRGIPAATPTAAAAGVSVATDVAVTPIIASAYTAPTQGYEKLPFMTGPSDNQNIAYYLQNNKVRSDTSSYSNVLPVLNDAIANYETVTFTFHTATQPIAWTDTLGNSGRNWGATKSSWGEDNNAFLGGKGIQKVWGTFEYLKGQDIDGYNTALQFAGGDPSKVKAVYAEDWYGDDSYMSFAEHLYNGEANIYGPQQGWDGMGEGYVGFDWAGQNLFGGALVINENLTMSLSDIDYFDWTATTLSFDWDAIMDGAATSNQYATYIQSIKLATSVRWYWDSLDVVLVAGGETESADVAASTESEDETLDETPTEDEELTEDEPVEDEPVEDEPVEDEPVEDEPVEDEPAPVEDEPAPEPAPEVAPNPTTGNAPVALAVIPVALAAAAVVAKKRG